jgi:hypothetical protein
MLLVNFQIRPITIIWEEFGLNPIIFLHSGNFNYQLSSTDSNTPFSTHRLLEKI